MIGKVLFLSNFTQVPLKWQHTPHCLQNQVIPIEYINLESWVSMNIFPEKSIKLLQTDKSKACVSNIRKAASLSKFPKVSEHERKLQTSFKTVANAGFLFGEAFFAPIQQILAPCTIFTTSSGGEGLKMISRCICLHLWSAWTRLQKRDILFWIISIQSNLEFLWEQEWVALSSYLHVPLLSQIVVVPFLYYQRLYHE